MRNINKLSTLEIWKKIKETLYTKEDMKRAFEVGFQVGLNDEVSPSYLTFEEWIKNYK